MIYIVDDGVIRYDVLPGHLVLGKYCHVLSAGGGELCPLAARWLFPVIKNVQVQLGYPHQAFKHFWFRTLLRKASNTCDENYFHHVSLHTPREHGSSRVLKQRNRKGVEKLHPFVGGAKFCRCWMLPHQGMESVLRKFFFLSMLSTVGEKILLHFSFKFQENRF